MKGPLFSPGRFLSGVLLLLIACQAPRVSAGPAKQSNGGTRKHPTENTVPQGELTKIETFPFPAPAPASILSFIPCFEGNELYVVYGETQNRGGMVLPPSPPSLPVRRLTLDSQGIKQYPRPSLDGYQTAARIAFNVGPLGALYGLFQAYRHVHAVTDSGAQADYVVVKYNDDGSVDSQAALSGIPSGRLTPHEFEAFPNGTLLVIGILQTVPMSRQQAARIRNPKFLPKGVTGHPIPGLLPFAGIFDRSGDFMQQLRLGQDAGSNPGPANGDDEGTEAAQSRNNEARKSPGSVPPKDRWLLNVGSSLMISGPEGDIYVLWPSNPAVLYEISSGGQVVHKTEIKFPAPNVHPTQMSRAGDSQIFITFMGTEIDKNREMHGITMTALVNPMNGKILSTFQLPPHNGLLPACAAGPNELLFIGSLKDNRLEIVKYAAR
jgi:hypothetical protein